MLAGLIYGLFLGGSAIGAAIENAQCKTQVHDFHGIKYYFDRKGCSHTLDGRKIIIWPDGTAKYVGGAWIISPEQAEKEKIDKRNQESLNESKRFGYLAYKKYDPYYKKEIPIEISTGKPIACVYKESCYGFEMQQPRYRKFYLKGHPSEPTNTASGDWGVPIAEDEYHKLSRVCPEHSPSDETIRKGLFKRGIDPYAPETLYEDGAGNKKPTEIQSMKFLKVPDSVRRENHRIITRYDKMLNSFVGKYKDENELKTNIRKQKWTYEAVNIIIQDFEKFCKRYKLKMYIEE